MTIRSSALQIVKDGRSYGDKYQFEYHLCASYTMDVRFQQGTILSGSHDDVKSWYSKKHEMHWLKTKVSVSPSGICINTTDHDKESVADISIL